MININRQLLQAKNILLSAIEEIKPAAVIGLFSGGHDSYTVTHFAAECLGDKLTAVCHIDTGIGIPETQQFVIDRCKAHNWPLEIYRAVENVNADGTPNPMIYEELVLKHGFPGPYSHGMMYALLKERQVRRIVRDHKTRDPVLLISGCRKEESTRRMGNTKEVSGAGSTWWVAPFTHMTGSDCAEYMRSRNLPKNIVKERLCMSGECLCGAFAHSNELEEIEYWYPEVGKRIRTLEVKVREAGFPWGWEDSPPDWWSKRQAAKKSGQVDAFEAEAEQEIEFLCSSCHFKHESTKE